MKFRLYEYNVTNNKEQKKEVIIELNENKILYNNRLITDEKKVKSVTELL